MNFQTINALNYSILKNSILLVLLIIISTSGKISGQNINHIIETLQIGEILALSSSDTVINKNGKEIIYIEYQAITIGNIGLENCLELLKATSLHKYFVINAIATEKTKIDSNNEWLNYYSFKGIGKMPDYDCVLKIKLIENNDTRSFTIIGKSSPIAIEDQGVERIEYYEVKCFVRELDSEKIEISLFAKFEPLFATSDRKINIWYPNPTNILKGIVYAVKNFQNKPSYLAQN